MNNVVNELVSKIKRYAQLYYEGTPEVSDDVFDTLVEELRSIDKDNPILYTTGWGYVPYGTKADHIYGGMQSISRKPRSLNGIPEDYSLVRLSPKLDGLSGAVYYKDGEFYLGVTRGNGLVGINKTEKFRRLLGEFTSFTNNFTGALRGELVMSVENWNKYKSIHPEAKDPRNVAAGIINRDSMDEIEFVDFVIYKVIASNDINIFGDTASRLSDVIFSNYRNSVQYRLVDRGDLSQEYLEEYFNEMRKLYPCDGVVITDNELKYDYKTGCINYDEVAYKFNGESKQTTVVGIDWNRTRTGKLIPTIVFEPIDLDGATIRRCAGFNAKFIDENGINCGSEITVARSGGVIPDFQSTVRKMIVELPEVCPVCGSKLEWDGVNLVCNNDACSGSDTSDLYVWVNTLASVHGLGGSIQSKFFDDNGIKTIEDLYVKHIRKQIVVNGSTSYKDKISAMISQLFINPINPVYALVSLNIPRLGWKSAEKLVENNLFNDVLNIDKHNTDSYNKLINCVGIATANSIVDSIDKLNRLNLIKGRIFIGEKDHPKSASKGEVVITGKLETCKRSEFEKIIQDSGYALASSVKEGIRYLITNTPFSGSSKNKKADELGIEKITESGFLALIGRSDLL